MKTEVRYPAGNMLNDVVVYLESEDVLRKMPARRIAGYISAVSEHWHILSSIKNKTEEEAIAYVKINSWILLAEKIKQSRR